MFQKARFQTVFHPPGYPFSANPLIVPTQSFASGKEDTRNLRAIPPVLEISITHFLFVRSSVWMNVNDGMVWLATDGEVIVVKNGE
jgi:hypothetical protein